jgi:antitoxin (DNA-binding transcriptional repressor) of toxin-antitoxin stability system
MKLIRLAEAGEVVVIERHGHPVAQLRAVPPELRPQKDDTLDAAFNELLSPRVSQKHPALLKWPYSGNST